MSVQKCPHIKNLSEELLSEHYNVIYAVRKPEDESDQLYRSYIQSKCHTCSEIAGRLHMCLDCPYIGCSAGHHIQNHLKQASHEFAVECSYGPVYCSKCEDYVYEPKRDEVLRTYRKRKLAALAVISPSVALMVDSGVPRAPSASETNSLLLGKREFDEGGDPAVNGGNSSSSSSNPSPSSSIGQGDYFVINLGLDPGADDGQLNYMTYHNKRRRITKNCTYGLRGLINLGSTCFMNCIIQALVHTPILCEYFLSDIHYCYSKNRKQCLVCELSKLFQEFFSGNKQPLVLARLLHLVWTQARHLAGYEQQDAHEFFIATLDVLHRHSEGVDSVPPQSHVQCTCIIDRIFTGGLQSDVVCLKCKSVSTKIDPFWDISLDIGSGTPEHPDDATPRTLIECLERFTRPEHLGAQAKFNCRTCGSAQESTKQLTMKTLPFVASFHLKRFEHSLKNQTKISTHISFPEHLDMSPFVSCRRSCSNPGPPPSESDGPSDGVDDIAHSDHLYSLFAVINHKGVISSGHYISFVRHQTNEWFKCDDDQITRADIREVLNSEGYLLFYHKRFLTPE